MDLVAKARQRILVAAVILREVKIYVILNEVKNLEILHFVQDDAFRLTLIPADAYSG